MKQIHQMEMYLLRKAFILYSYVKLYVTIKQFKNILFSFEMFS